MLITFDLNIFIKSTLIIFFTVILIYILKLFANIKVELISVSTDLNLFTFGFLFDIALKAMNNEPYWINYSGLLSKNYLLLLIFTGNALVMMLNFKLEDYLKKVINDPNHSNSLIDYFHKPIILFLGIVSFTVYLVLNLTFS